ncbi:MAG: M20/M25/M40 family metallo-hydrolase [Candidatus Dormibacteria bacterium]|jgi:acetylornithine deacetylase/succinyl-diaminopimelate desuccinylase-like protein
MAAMVSFSDSDAEYVRQLSEFVAIPSVSRDATPETMRRAAAWLADQVRFAQGRIVETEGNPVVLGELAGPSGAPTVLVYGHYDVQPTGSLAEWVSPPFELTVDGEVMRGRGATDDKGPVFIVLKVAQAFAAQEGAAPVHVKFVFEGEEEIGSPNFANFVRGRSKELSAELVISADGAMWRPNEPSLSVGSKGLVGLDIEVTGADGDLHSGRYGGTVANPLHALVQVLASLHTIDGAVAVPGFYDGIPELGPSRREEISRVAFDEADFQCRLGVPDLYGEPGYSTLERLWERPTLEINGVKGGGKYTVIPHIATGHVSCRLVPCQDPDAVLQAIADHVAAQPVTGIRVTVRADPGGVPAYTISPDHPAVRAATAALNHVYPDQPVLLAKIGGTLPATVLFEDILGAKTLFFSFSTADERLHAPNEYMRIRRLREGMRAWERLWRLLGDGPHRLRAS